MVNVYELYTPKVYKVAKALFWDLVLVLCTLEAKVKTLLCSHMCYTCKSSQESGSHHTWDLRVLAAHSCCQLDTPLYWLLLSIYA